MWPVFPLSETLPIIAIIAVVILFSAAVIQPAWLRSRAVRAVLLAAAAVIGGGIVLWLAGESMHRGDIVRLGVGSVYVTVLTLLPAAIVMPFTAAVDRWLTRDRALALATVKPEASDEHDEHDATLAASYEQDGKTKTWRRKLSTTRVKVSRRALIRFGSASIPTMAAMTGASGFSEAKRDPTMPIVRMRYPNLHPDLHGLKILHLSDLHLGAGCLDLDDLKRGLEIAFARGGRGSESSSDSAVSARERDTAASHPDLIMLTGDLADDPALIPAALRLIAEANARYGALACLGNHEYLHDISITRPKYEAGPIPLLVGTGRSLRIGRATLFVGGSDDPVHMHGDIASLLEPSIASAASASPRHADFRLLLCHRPEGFAPANVHGFDLTLSGHTHGGQVGAFGRSLLEKVKPGIGWWGTYAKKRPREVVDARDARLVGGPNGVSRLYTTSGFGHWFPFRVGCPTEMPLIVLEAEPSAASDELEA